MLARKMICICICACLAGCGDVKAHGDEDSTADTEDEDVAGDLGDVEDDTAGDPAEDTAGDPVEDTGGDADVIEDPAGDDAATAEPGCGNGVVESGEECDDSSDFCVDCALTAPTDWVECTDSSGNTAFLFIEDWAGDHTQQEFRDHCESMIEGMGSPTGYQYYGLAVFHDQDIWDCIEPSLDRSESYYVGLYQDTSASDYSEPDGGWYWMANDGTGQTDVAPFDPAGPVPGDLNDAGGSGNVECGRIERTWTGWEYRDYSCDDPQAWLGICMIQY